MVILHVAILVARMVLLEGPPVITEDLLEGVFVDPLPCGCHSAGLYHVFAPRATQLCTLIRPSFLIVFSCSNGQKGGFSKRKFLYGYFCPTPENVKSAPLGFLLLLEHGAPVSWIAIAGREGIKVHG